METGLIKKQKTPSPPASPAGFVWPSPRTVNKATKLAFSAATSAIARERGVTHMDIARALFGTKKNAEGYLTARSNGVARKWLGGHAFPFATNAGYLAQFLGVPMAALLGDKAARIKKANGHGELTRKEAITLAESLGMQSKPGPKPKPVRPALVLLPLPKDAPPVAVKLETYPGNPHFMAVAITGTVQVEVALSLMAMLHPEQPAQD